MKRNKKIEATNTDFSIWVYLKGIIAAYIFVLFVFLIMALLLTYTNIPEAMIPMFSSITLIVSVSISGMYVGAKYKKKGWLNGGVEGILYITLLIVVSWVFIEDFSFDRFVIYKAVIGVISGGIGGIIGVNLK